MPQGNWIDLIILMVVFLYLLSGYRRGFILGLLDLGGFLFSFLFALKFYPVIGQIFIQYFSISRGIANAVGFLFIGLFTESLSTFLIRFFIRPIYKYVFPKNDKKKDLFILFDQILGIIPIMGESLIFISFILTLIVSLPVHGTVKKEITSSRIGGFFVAKTQGIERQLNNIFKDAVYETLTFLTVNSNPEITDRIDLGFSLQNLNIDTLSENSMFTLINNERLKRGIPQLVEDEKLQTLARDYAFDMFRRGYFSHYNPENMSPFDRMDYAGIDYLSAGENLAYAPDVYLAHEGLMNSEGHRENILSPDFSKVGIGVVDGGIYGQIFVQEFNN